MSSRLSARDLAHEWPDGRVLFANLNLSLDDGVTALVGHNGVGKSTLARLLAGELAPARGSVARAVPVAYFPQRVPRPPGRLGDFLGDAWPRTRATDGLLAGLDPETPCASLSGGEWMRARLAALPPEGYLILDEPGNDLDDEARAILQGVIAARADGVLLISHDRALLALCDAVLELSTQGLARYGGGYADYLEARERERETLTRDLARAEREREIVLQKIRERSERQERRNRQGARDAARGGAPKILLGLRKRAAQATTGRLETENLARSEAAAREAREAFAALKVDPVSYAKLQGEPLPARKLAAAAEGFNIRLGRWLYARDLDFVWRGNARVAIRGGNGAGKSTLLRALRGERFETCGRLVRSDVPTLYLDQHCALPDEEATLCENVQRATGLTEGEARNRLAGFLFAREAAFRKARDLSGGERLRAALAIASLREESPGMMILDEPTNNLDLAHVEFLERVVSVFRGALIVVSHDEGFLKACGVVESLRLAVCSRLKTT